MKKSVLFVVLFLSLLPKVIEAKLLPADALPILTHTQVLTTVEYDGASGLYTYQYSVTNPTTNTGEVRTILLDNSIPSGGAALSSEGFMVNQGGLGNRRITYDDEVLNSGLGHLIPGVSRSIPPNIPVGIEVPQVEPPREWMAGINFDGRIRWGTGSFSTLIQPGQSTSGFVVTSRGLPTIRAIRIEPYFVPPGNVEQEEYSDEDYAEIKALENSIAFKGKTLGPTAPPAVFDSLAFIGTIRGYIAESQTLGWLNADLAATLNGHMDAVITAINTGDIATAKLQVQAFIDALPIPPSGTAACTSECSGLLVFNAQYLLDQLSTKPDLRVTGLTPNRMTVTPGEKVNVDVTVRNQGGNSSSSTLVRLRLGELDFRPTGLPELSSGETKTVTGQVILPDTLPAGPHSLIACVDPDQFVDELSETNNCLETFLTITTDLKPDMTVTAVSSPPATTYAGGGFSVTDTTANEGFTTATTTVTRYYLSADIQKSGDDILLVGAREILSLVGQATMPGTELVALPESAAEGPYFLVACADDLLVVTERDEANNCAASTEKTMVSSEKRSDLQISGVSEPPEQLLKGRSFSVTDTAINNGAVGAPAPLAFTVGYYFSTDRVKDPSDILLGSRLINSLLVGEESSTTTTVTVPTTTKQGVYFLLSCSDIGDTVLERNEANNCLGSLGTTRYTPTDLPDLLMTSISNPPGVIGPWGLFSVTDTVKNAGISGAGRFNLNYYFSADRVKDPSDIFLTESRGINELASRGINELASRGLSSGTVEMIVPSETASGRYFLLACADEVDKRVAEGNEENNCIASATTVLVKGPDLIITAVSGVFGKVLVGIPFSVTNVVFNQSPAPATESVTGYFLSRDPVFDNSDIKLSSVEDSRPFQLTGFGVLTETNELVVPSGKGAGRFYLIVCADQALIVEEDQKLIVNDVKESDETNNCLTSVKLAEVEGPDLIVTSVTNPPLSIIGGESFSVTDTVKNSGSSAAGASMTDYYLGQKRFRYKNNVKLFGNRLINALKGGESSLGAATLTIPEKVFPGYYYLISCANGFAEIDERNNCLPSEQQVRVGGPDLVVTALSNPPATVFLGESFLMTDTVANQGEETAGSSVTGYLLFSEGVAGTFIFSERGVDSLAMGASSTGTSEITVSRDFLWRNILIGKYRVRACADVLFDIDGRVDFNGRVPEIEENNNCTTAEGEMEVRGPDLFIEAVGIGTTTAMTGKNIAITDTVRNQGTAAAGRFHVNYFLSVDTVHWNREISMNIPMLPSRFVEGLGVAESSTATTEVTVPVVRTGDYYVIACPSGLLDGNTFNDCKASGILSVQGMTIPVRTIPNRSPVSALPPIIHCKVDGDCEFPVPAADPDGDRLSFRLARSAEAAEMGIFNQPGPPHAPSAANIDRLTGVYRWNTQGARLTPDSVSAPNTLYSTQVIIEENDRVSGAEKGTVAIDFFIRLVPEVGQSPRFHTPPTPACGTTLFGAVGERIAFTVAASNDDIGAQVTLNGIGIPFGATVVPALPVTGNPVRSEISFVPNSGQAVVMTFSATNENGGQALCPIIVQVGEGGALSLSPLSATSSVGTTHTVTATATRFSIPTSGVTMNFAVSGVHSDVGSCVTDAVGQCAFRYTGTTAGTDTITATSTLAGQSLTATASKKWNPVLTLLPLTATNLIHATHTVMAKVSGAVPPEGITIAFTVSGSHNLSGSCVTDAASQCTFGYTGMNIGVDTIRAQAVVGDVALSEKVMTKWEAKLTLIQDATATMINNAYTTVVKINGAIPLEGVIVKFTVSGSNSFFDSCVTNSAGQCVFTYTGTQAGTDRITVEVVVGGATLSTTGQNTWWEPTLSLTPKRPFKQIGEEHTITVLIAPLGMSFPNVTVAFAVSGNHSLVGSCVTDFSSQCTFSYPGVTVGVDTIVAKTVIGNLTPEATATAHFWDMTLTNTAATNPTGTTHTVTALITRESPPRLLGTPLSPLPFTERPLRNDEIANAIPITTIPFGHTVQTEKATISANEPAQSCGNPPNSNSVWYRLTAETNGVVMASTLGSTYDTTLSAWTEDLKTELICNDDTIEASQSEITFPVVSGQTIFLQVTDYNPSSNGGLLIFTLTPPSVSDINVDFGVSGANSTTDFCVTNETGQCSFTYEGLWGGIDYIEAIAENIFNVPTPGHEPDLGFRFGHEPKFGEGELPGERKVEVPENFLTLYAIAFKIWIAQKLTLSPTTATHPVGTTHTVTATALMDGTHQNGVTVNIAVSGANVISGSCVTDATGQCSFSYTGMNAGTDAITATGTVFGMDLTAQASKTWVKPELLLAPATGTNSVGTTHTVTATALMDGTHQNGVTVNIAVSGANVISGSCVTDATGQCSFSYTGMNAGPDTITATAKVAGFALTATASKTWVRLEKRVPQGGTTASIAVSGTNKVSGSCVTNATGQCSFPYTGTIAGTESSQEVTPSISVVSPEQTFVPVPLPEVNVFYEKVQPEAKIKITDSNIHFVVTDAHFKFNSAKLNSRGKKKVAEYTQFLMQNPNLSVTIEGHTDRRGRKRYNHQLGLRRAKAVWHEIKRHLVRNKMEVVSYGEDRPIDPAHTEAAYAKNRRVEIHVNEGKALSEESR